MKKNKVAVIGGGYTGLTAAYDLAKKGYDVTLFEKNLEVGGLAVDCVIDDLVVEKIWHFIYMTDSEIISLAKELGLEKSLIFYDSSIATIYDKKLYPFMTPKDLLLFSPLSFLDRIRTGAVGLYLQMLRNWKPLTRVTAYEWMKKYVGERSSKIIWEPLLRGKFDSYYDKVLMSWLWKRIKVRADSKKDAHEKLGYFTGSFKVITDGLKKGIENRGGIINCGVDVLHIKNNDDGAVEVVSDDGEYIFDSVVATVPTSTFSRLIAENKKVDTEYLAKLNSIAYVGAIVMIFVSTQEISEYYWHNINDDDIPFVVFLANSVLMGREMFDGKNLYYIGFYAEHDHKYFTASEEGIMNEWEDGLRKIFPDFDASEITEKKLYKFKNAQHIVDKNYEDRIPPCESIIPNVFLANFSQIYPDDRGLNYAILEGRKVAQMIDDNLKKK